MVGDAPQAAEERLPAVDHSDLSMFHNTGVAKPSSTPESDLRHEAITQETVAASTSHFPSALGSEAVHDAVHDVVTAPLDFACGRQVGADDGGDRVDVGKVEKTHREDIEK